MRALCAWTNPPLRARFPRAPSNPSFKLGRQGSGLHDATVTAGAFAARRCGRNALSMVASRRPPAMPEAARAACERAQIASGRTGKDNAFADFHHHGAGCDGLRAVHAFTTAA